MLQLRQQIQSVDPGLPTFAGVTLLLTAVVLAASYVPALRAMRLDPITILQSE